jgi:hypothetical protein
VTKESVIRVKGLDYFRRTTAMLYREIGVLLPKNHAAMAARARLSEPFFKDRKIQARQLYKFSLTDLTVDSSLARYEKKTGLTVHDIREAFANGKWGNPPSFGGPKWATIAEAVIQISDALRQKNWKEVERLTSVIDQLRHNNGRLVDKFSQLD